MAANGRIYAYFRCNDHIRRTRIGAGYFVIEVQKIFRGESSKRILCGICAKHDEKRRADGIIIGETALDAGYARLLGAGALDLGGISRKDLIPLSRYKESLGNTMINRLREDDRATKSFRHV